VERRINIMTSLDLISFKKNIKDYIDTCGLPKEAARLVLKELLEETTKEAIAEAYAEAKKAETEASDA